MSKRILLCDDEVHIIRAAEFKLARAGYDVECAADGMFGWEAVQRQKPDLLITDCQMPRMNGLELIEKVRSNPATKDIPILMLTAKGFELAQHEVAEKWNVLDIIAKPFSPRDLLRRINELFGATVAVSTDETVTASN